jgi:hypothetical protein
MRMAPIWLCGVVNRRWRVKANIPTPSVGTRKLSHFSDGDLDKVAL